MVIEFTDNTVVLDMKYNQLYFMGWIGWDWENKINDYFGVVRYSRLVWIDIQRRLKNKFKEFILDKINGNFFQSIGIFE